MVAGYWFCSSSLFREVSSMLKVDCYLIGVWDLVGESGGLVIDALWWWFVRLGLGWGVGGSVYSFRLRLCVS